MKNIIVAIDVYSSCGKSTMAKALAEYAGYTYVDTGAMYRAVALYAIQNQLDIDQLINGLNNIHISFQHYSDGQHVMLNGTDVEKQIRTLEVGNRASQIASVKEIRQFLVAQQQRMGEQKGIVMDGRDIGTVVFPHAELKLFLTATPEERANRRFNELKLNGLNPVYEEVLHDVNDRDYRDTHREESPLKQAPDAIVVDNTHMTKQQQLQTIIDIFNTHL
jgi:cytidylate kinase